VAFFFLYSLKRLEIPSKCSKIATLGESIPVVAIIFIFPPDWEQ
jgi:hypothetical protein